MNQSARTGKATKSSIFDVIETDDQEGPPENRGKDDILKLYQHVESKLSTRERLVLKMRYGLYNEEEYTQREIAKLLGISRSYVSSNRKERY